MVLLRARKGNPFVNFVILLIAALFIVLFSARIHKAHAAEPIYGIASWYDSKSACRFNPDPKCPTALGRSLYALEEEKVNFAAMWDVPLKTRVRVTALETGKSTEVFILDRGPAKVLRNRIIDLGKKSFEEISQSRRGLTPVKVEILE